MLEMATSWYNSTSSVTATICFWTILTEEGSRSILCVIISFRNMIISNAHKSSLTCQSLTHGGTCWVNSNWTKRHIKILCHWKMIPGHMRGYFILMNLVLPLSTSKIVWSTMRFSTLSNPRKQSTTTMVSKKAPNTNARTIIPLSTAFKHAHRMQSINFLLDNTQTIPFLAQRIRAVQGVWYSKIWISWSKLTRPWRPLILIKMDISAS